MTIMNLVFDSSTALQKRHLMKGGILPSLSKGIGHSNLSNQTNLSIQSNQNDSMIMIAIPDDMCCVFMGERYSRSFT